MAKVRPDVEKLAWAMVGVSAMQDDSMDGIGRVASAMKTEQLPRMPKPKWGSIFNGHSRAFCNICPGLGLNGAGMDDDKVLLDFLGQSS